MKNNLLFEFTVSEKDNTVHVKREFAANLESVWKAWTNADILDKWWAPKPYRAETKQLDFREGGIWLYVMISPEDEKHWSKAEYKKIEDKKMFSWEDAFCDEDGKENPEMPGSSWTNIFTEHDGITTVDITINHEKPEDREAMLKMGFKEGFTMGLNNLEELLPTLGK